eukprot:c19752_g1_i5.p1 GENE.c19752_g1_i5~~c19752_g1_i5.p1  ORF type:complete len:498 (-),score=52.56 c19752_g1_i5:1067-2560(-)
MVAATHLLNRTPSGTIGWKTPFELWHGVPPPLGHVRVFGCVANVVEERRQVGKLDKRTWAGVLVGFTENDYAVWDPLARRVSRSRSVTFFENVFWTWAGDNPTITGDHGSAISPLFADQRGGAGSGVRGEQNLVLSTPTPKSTQKIAGTPGRNLSTRGTMSSTGREKGLSPVNLNFDEPADVGDQAVQDRDSVEPVVAPDVQDIDNDSESEDEMPGWTAKGWNHLNPSTYGRGLNFQQPSKRKPPADRGRSGLGTNAQPREHVALVAHQVNEPLTFTEAMQSEFSAEWLVAMQEEMKAHIDQGTWTLVPKERHQGKPVKNKWIFTVLANEHGDVDRFKARLVVKGCSQVFGLNYTETYAPVARMTTLRLLFALAIQRGQPIHTSDISNAYLHARLNEHEHVFMQQPEGFVMMGREEDVCELRLALYGLKQAARAWYERLTSFLGNSLGMTQSPHDNCLFTLTVETAELTLVIYVDDLVFTGTPKLLHWFEEQGLSSG